MKMIILSILITFSAQPGVYAEDQGNQKEELPAMLGDIDQDPYFSHLYTPEERSRLEEKRRRIEQIRDEKKLDDETLHDGEIE